MKQKRSPDKQGLLRAGLETLARLEREVQIAERQAGIKGGKLRPCPCPPRTQASACNCRTTSEIATSQPCPCWCHNSPDYRLPD